jgi:hypothetical protein
MAVATVSQLRKAIKKSEIKDKKQDAAMHEKLDSKQMKQLKKKAAAKAVKRK